MMASKDKKPISQEDREMYEWISKKLQDRAEGREEVFSEEDLKPWGDEPTVTEGNTVPANKQFGRHAETKSVSESERLQEQLEPIIHEDKDEDEVGEEPETEGQQDG